MDTTKVLTVQEVAARLRVHPITVYRLLQTAHLPEHRIGLQVRPISFASDGCCGRAERAPPSASDPSTTSGGPETTSIQSSDTPGPLLRPSDADI